jgi:hypothetical protein
MAGSPGENLTEKGEGTATGGRGGAGKVVGLEGWQEARKAGSTRRACRKKRLRAKNYIAPTPSLFYDIIETINK